MTFCTCKDKWIVLHSWSIFIDWSSPAARQLSTSHFITFEFIHELGEWSENDQRTISQFCQQSVSTVWFLSSLLMSCFNSNSTLLQRLYDQEYLNQVPRTQIIIVLSALLSENNGRTFWEGHFMRHIFSFISYVSQLLFLHSQRSYLELKTSKSLLINK